MDIKNYSLEARETLWAEIRRLQNPHQYYVDLSKDLWNLKEFLLHEYSSMYEE